MKNKDKNEIFTLIGECVAQAKSATSTYISSFNPSLLLSFSIDKQDAKNIYISYRKLTGKLLKIKGECDNYALNISSEINYADKLMKVDDLRHLCEVFDKYSLWCHSMQEFIHDSDIEFKIHKNSLRQSVLISAAQRFCAVSEELYRFLNQ